ncbi:MAG: AAA family ATPase [Oscillospiraceae bacterium]
MYLKSLEIQGFKSFPDKTLLQFGSDCTAIVGPNGSGKSNISDAISWVLGEQSTRALRGAKMEDVIFGGTAKRPAVGYAEATLVLDNSDASLRIETPEVMITRRYFRSGESEYYINKQLARLKDINELFMDTGLGREGYSNIGQGRIDEILALKSTDRRRSSRKRGSSQIPPPQGGYRALSGQHRGQFPHRRKIPSWAAADLKSRRKNANI